MGGDALTRGILRSASGGWGVALASACLRGPSIGPNRTRAHRAAQSGSSGRPISGRSADQGGEDVKERTEPHEMSHVYGVRGEIGGRMIGPAMRPPLRVNLPTSGVHGLAPDRRSPGLLIGLGTLRWFWLGALLLAIPGLLIAALGAGTFSFP